MEAGQRVVGRPDARWQEVPVAFVVRRAGAVLSAEDLSVHARAHLARFKCPREVVFVSELPRNALGKVQYFRLHEALEGAGRRPPSANISAGRRGSALDTRVKPGYDE